MAPSVARLVGDALREDVVLSESLARGIVSTRALARWLKKAHAIEGGEESVVSAIRRYKVEHGKGLFEPARAALRQGHIDMHGNMVSYVIANTTQSQARLSDLFKHGPTSRGHVLRVISSERGIKLITNEQDFDLITELMGSQSIEDAKHGLTEFAITVPASSRATPGILAVVSQALALHRISIAEIVDGVGAHNILVSTDEALRAHDVLGALIHRGPGRNRPKARGRTGDAA